MLFRASPLVYFLGAGVIGMLSVILVNGEFACPGNWSMFADSCLTVTRAGYIGDGATAGCAAIGGNLAVPRNPEENEFARLLPVPGQPVWIGCRRIAVEVYPCTDGDIAVQYGNWDPYMFGESYCVYMLNGTWADADCEDEPLRPALCRRAPLPKTPDTGNCGKTLQRWSLLAARLTGHVLREIRAPSLKPCVLACEAEPQCRSVNFISDRMTAVAGAICQLNNATRFDADADALAFAPALGNPLCVYGEK
ncbi:uncharacterized protein LOC119738057 [Patiria miniata]|uniref:Apple domain-containing protein n=1 Tax=Patiria miniata TaxID=46514 RepID=A0A914AX53_PATMI|nr:uncharacterized protein LOC119738057 [Patiria miniata]